MNFINNITNIVLSINGNFILTLIKSIIIILFFKIISPLVAYIVIRMFHLKEKNKNKIKQNAFYKPIKSFLLVLGLYLATLIFNLPQNISLIIYKIFKICIILIVANGFANLFDFTSDYYEKLRKKFSFRGHDTLFNFITKLLKILVYIFAAFIIISELGYNLNGLVAGLGISSVVVALAAQNLAKNIIDGFSILLDKPFNVGDFIEFGEFSGTVEDLTFRTTRIRNLDNKVVIIPNSKIADETIVNISKLEKRRFCLNLTLELSTSLEKVAILNSHIKEFLLSNPNILEDKMNITFDNISDNGIDVLIAFYTTITDYWDFLKFKEEINYSLLDLINKEQIELAYNSQTIYLKK